MKIKGSKKAKRLAIALFLVFLVALFFTGCVGADRNTRRIGFGDTTPIVSKYTGEGDRRGLIIYLFGHPYTIDVTPWFWAAQSIARGVDQVGKTFQDIAGAWEQQMTPKDW